VTDNTHIFFGSVILFGSLICLGFWLQWDNRHAVQVIHSPRVSGYPWQMAGLKRPKQATQADLTLPLISCLRTFHWLKKTMWPSPTLTLKDGLQCHMSAQKDV
jgi:hypothetical protein